MRADQRGRLARVLALMLVLTLLGAASWGVITTLRLRHHLSSARTAAEMALGYLEAAKAGGGTGVVGPLRNPAQLSALQSTLSTLDADLAAIEKLIGPFLPVCAYLGWLPGVGGDLEAAPHLLAMARHSIDAAQALSDGLIPLAGYLGQAGPGLGRATPDLVRGLFEAQTQIDSASASLALAMQSRNAVDSERVSPRIQELIHGFDSYLPSLEVALTGLSVLPDLFGASGARAYLLIAQNNQELRPTGGFISGVGVARIEDGRITELSFQDSYSVDDLSQPHPAPPAALRRLMGAGMLVLRDANWWADFPTSAKALGDLYEQDKGQPLDGVIAVDLTTLQLLLQALGPIQVPGYDQPVSSGNLQDMIMSYWEAPRVSAPGKEGTDWWFHRKDFAADLMGAMLVHVMDRTTPEDLIGLAQALARALHERHMLIYSHEPRSQALLSELGWDGALRPSDGDYVMIVDSNVGFNKVNPNIEQTADYHIVLERPGEATATLTLTYRHRVQKPMPACVHESRYGDDYADLLERCYWDYLRVYIPAGSKLLDVVGADGPVTTYEESGRTVIATSFLLETAQARQIRVTYRPNLPDDLGSRYFLLVQKQPGTDALPLRVRVVPPNGTPPAAVSPAGWAWVNGVALWHGALGRDQAIELIWD
jgi:hypothetical protein